MAGSPSESALLQPRAPPLLLLLLPLGGALLLSFRMQEPFPLKCSSTGMLCTFCVGLLWSTKNMGIYSPICPKGALGVKCVDTVNGSVATRPNFQEIRLSNWDSVSTHSVVVSTLDPASRRPFLRKWDSVSTHSVVVSTHSG
ncbi:hypothetical protein Taro_031620 [Colocasia esculenta]|uniref:Uncharacterized protein n=1 Tax=Colocasia esculenta TaxID=4460 RepID=A0A843W1G1_COLES|nr:hypothetical protein [Colocasia esculenta]